MTWRILNGGTNMPALASNLTPSQLAHPYRLPEIADHTVDRRRTITAAAARPMTLGFGRP